MLDKSELNNPNKTIGTSVAIPNTSITIAPFKTPPLTLALRAKKYTMPQGIEPFNNPNK